MKTINKELLTKNIEQNVNADLIAGRILGANIYVSQNNKELLKKSYGFSNIKKTKEMNFETIFRMASMTKPITTVCVMREVEKGNLDLFDTIEKFIPEYSNLKIGKIKDGKLVIEGDVINKPRILHLLTHSSGIGCGEVGDYIEKFIPSVSNKTLKDIVLYYSKQPLAFEPYTTNRYSPTVGFDILARIVEIVSGKNFEKYVQTEICQPLGMIDTTFVPSQEQLSRMCDMHTFDGKNIGKREMNNGCIFENIPITHFCGGAGIVSTLNDYIKFASMLQNYGEFNGYRVLNKGTIKAMALPHIPETVNTMGVQSWGLGMRVITSCDYKILPIGAFGWSGAYGTHFFIDLENKVTAVYMKNSAYDGGSGAITARHFEEDIFNSFE